MFRCAVLLFMLMTARAFAQVPAQVPTEAPDCTAEVDLAAGLKLDVHYLCRSNTPIAFEPVGRIEPRNGIVQARYRIDLANHQVNDPRELIVRGDGAGQGA